MNFELHTKRLILRPMKLEDAYGMYELNLPEDVFLNTGDKPFKNVDEAKTLILNYDQFEKYKMGRFSLIDKLTNDYVGWCGLKLSESKNEVDLGYRILPKFRGNGLAGEAAEKCLEYGFNTLALKSIVGKATKVNYPSIAILKNIGMTFTNEFIDHDTVCVEYSINSETWFSRMAHMNSNTKQN
ncbi:MAG: N-acetyltransferase [Bacteroidetes bacterium]|nr:MAG: N-acetyltransferase [Bacteroidota bacterium]